MGQAVVMMTFGDAVEELPGLFAGLDLRRLPVHPTRLKGLAFAKFQVVESVIWILWKGDHLLIRGPVADRGRDSGVIDNQFAYTADEKRVLGDHSKDIKVKLMAGNVQDWE